MNNLNSGKQLELGLLLASKHHEEKDMINILKLYILVRKGRSIDITLETNGVGVNHPAYSIIRGARTRQLIAAYNDAMFWFGLNYNV